MPRQRLPLPPWAGVDPVASHSIVLTVAFRDCDPMGVLWHGNYLAYCEAARNALGDIVGVGLRDLQLLDLFAPVVRSTVVHRAPARPQDALTISATLHPTAQPRLYHRYRMTIGDQVVAEADTDQVLTDKHFALILTQPSSIRRVLAPG